MCNIDLEKAKRILTEENHTIVLCKGDKILTSNETGISPMVGFLKREEDMKDFSAADRIVGKAAALLFVKAKIKTVFSEVMSKGAVEIFERFGIDYSYNILTGVIINRTKTGPCPMEYTVMNIDNPDEAFEAIKLKLSELRTKK